MYKEELRVRLFNDMESKDALLCVLNISSNKFDYLLYKKKNLYTSFTINKRNGGTRVIYSPCINLKKIQRELNEILIKNYQFDNNIVQGFNRGNSIKTNAKVHENSKYIINIDLKNFFDTIHFGRVRGMFMNKPFNFNNYIATNLAKITCYDRKLPQGAPTSGIIANIICYNLDRELNHLCTTNNCRYTRYADDITISTQSIKLPKIIGAISDDGLLCLSKKITDIINNQGFTINSNKLNISSINNRQEVTGLIVNNKTNVKKIYLKHLRAMLYNASKNGIYSEGCRYYKNSLSDLSNKMFIENRFIEMLRGKIEFLKMIRGMDDNVYVKYAKEFNNLVKRDCFETDYTLSIKEYMEKRIFPLMSFDNATQGSCFFTDKGYLYTSTHVFMNKDAFTSKEYYRRYKNADIINFHSKGIKPFYILSHSNIKCAIVPTLTKEDIKTDVSKTLYKTLINDKKSFKENHNYIPEFGETIYLAGYGEFIDFNKTSINYIKAEVTGTSTFDSRKFYCINKPIYHGMSGGPVINKNREVIGIIYAGLNEEETSKVNGFILFKDLV